MNGDDICRGGVFRDDDVANRLISVSRSFVGICGDVHAHMDISSSDLSTVSSPMSLRKGR